MDQTYRDVLVVDDEPQTLQYLSTLLKDHGYKTHMFLNGMDALSFLKFTDKKIYIIIADVNMPFMNGVQFLQKVKKLSKFQTIPFLFLSAVKDKNVRLKAYQEGAIDYMDKPVDNDVLLAKIDSMVNLFALTEFKNCVLMEGTRNKFSVEDILKYCEEEKLNGYSYLHGESGKGIMLFEKGVLGNVVCGKLRDTEAFERLISWGDYNFIIIRKKFDPEDIKQFIH